VEDARLERGRLLREFEAGAGIVGSVDLAGTSDREVVRRLAAALAGGASHVRVVAGMVLLSTRPLSDEDAREWDRLEDLSLPPAGS